MLDHWRGLVSVAETSECLAEVRSVDTKLSWSWRTQQWEGNRGVAGNPKVLSILDPDSCQVVMFWWRMSFRQHRARQQERCEESCTRWCLARGAFCGMCEMDVQGSRGQIQQWWWAGGAGAGWGVGLPVPICQVRDPHAGWEATRIFLQLLRSKPWGFLLSGLVTESLSYALESHCAAPVREKTGFGHWSPLGFW